MLVATQQDLAFLLRAMVVITLIKVNAIQMVTCTRLETDFLLSLIARHLLSALNQENFVMRSLKANKDKTCLCQELYRNIKELQICMLRLIGKHSFMDLSVSNEYNRLNTAI